MLDFTGIQLNWLEGQLEDKEAFDDPELQGEYERLKRVREENRQKKTNR